MSHNFNQQIIHISGGFSLKSGKCIGIGKRGPNKHSYTDSAFTSASYPTLSNTIGGFEFPYDVRIKELSLLYTTEGISATDAKWGWTVLKLNESNGTNATLAGSLWRENTGPDTMTRQQNTVPTRVIFDSTELNDTQSLLKRRQSLFIGVELATANIEKRQVYIQSGYFLVERV